MKIYIFTHAYQVLFALIKETYDVSVNKKAPLLLMLIEVNEPSNPFILTIFPEGTEKLIDDPIKLINKKFNHAPLSEDGDGSVIILPAPTFPT